MNDSSLLQVHEPSGQFSPFQLLEGMLAMGGDGVQLLPEAQCATGSVRFTLVVHIFVGICAMSGFSSISDDIDMSGSWEDDTGEEHGDFMMDEEDILEDEAGHEIRRNKSFDVLTTAGVLDTRHSH